MKASYRELALCGLLGAAALLLPVLFHLVHLGHVFMPMYQPLLVLAFLVGPAPAAVTALVVPMLSGAVTGMPPFYPPVAPFMAIELAVMGAIIAFIRGRWPRLSPFFLLPPVLLLGRMLYMGMMYGFAVAAHLPADFIAGLSLLGGWPGLLLAMALVPPVVKVASARPLLNRRTP